MEAARTRRGPRPASTYRAARRNQILRIERGVWRGVAGIYEPYQRRQDRRGSRRRKRMTMRAMLKAAAKVFMPMRFFRIVLR